MLFVGVIGNHCEINFTQLMKNVLWGAGIKVHSIHASKIDEITLETMFCDNANIDILAIYFGEKDIKNKFVKKVKFDIIIYLNNDDEYVAKIHDLKSNEIRSVLRDHLSPNGVIIVNEDSYGKSERQESVVSFGFSSFADITASSVGERESDDYCVCFLQEELMALNGIKQEPQEYKVNLHGECFNTHEVMAVLSVAIIAGVQSTDLDYINC